MVKPAPKPSYSMSGAGHCLRRLAAERLGYEKPEDPEFLMIAAVEGNRHEYWMEQDLNNRGWQVSKAVRCEPCDRDGIHVELEFPAFKYVGHYDRQAIKMETGVEYMVEMKALGRFRAEPLVKALVAGRFGLVPDYKGYAIQASLYHYATGLPILYAVKNRDTGRLRSFEIDPPVPLEEIVDYTLGAELCARKEKLGPCNLSSSDFWFRNCPYKYLHEPEAVIESEAIEDVEPFVVDFFAAKARKEAAEADMNDIKAELFGTVHKQKKFQVTLPDGRVAKLNYVKEGKTNTHPQALLEQHLTKTLLAKCTSSNPRAAYITITEAT